MADTQKTRVFVPVLSLMALAGALFGVITAAETKPPNGVELVLNLSESARSHGGMPIVAP